MTDHDSPWYDLTPVAAAVADGASASWMDLAALAAAAEQFTKTWADDGQLADSIGKQLNCAEADALVAMLTALGEPDAAETWFACHVAGDDAGDGHHDHDDASQ